jgi:hypothetical protein
MQTVVLKKDDDVDQERFVERLARFVGEEAVVRAYVRLDNHLGIATASVVAHLRANHADTI